jgi:hypothetical protein
MPTVTTSVITGASQYKYSTKKNEMYVSGKGRKFSVLIVHITNCIENSKQYTDEYFELIKAFNNVA